MAGVGAQSASISPQVSTMSVYGRVLGAAQLTLAPAVQQLHCGGKDVEAIGRFAVARGNGPTVRFIARCLGLPAADVDVPLRLRIQRGGDTERWHREFGRHRCLSTTQRAVSGGCVEERVGATRLLLHVRAQHGALEMRQVSAGIRLGRRLHLPLPAWLCPRTTARVAPAGDGRMTVAVRVTLPSGRLLVSYSGVVEQVR